MTLLISFIILVVLMVIAVFVAELLKSEKKTDAKKKEYDYKKKDFLMSRAEHEFYDVLLKAVGNDYYIFPQIHLSSIVDNKITGQNWKAAFRHINGKSVDFVLCDKAYIAPKLAIELDDKTHSRVDRQNRDEEVERILEDAELPILRIENKGSFNQEEITQKINSALNPST